MVTEDTICPVTIIAGRYAEPWLAFHAEPDTVDPRILAGDNDWADWKDDTSRDTYGIGATPQAALTDLVARLRGVPADPPGP